MALFNRFFFSSAKRKSFGSSQSHEYLSQFPFEDGQVRVLLYRECDRSGRRLLFDSSAITKVNLADLEPTQTYIPKVNGVKTKNNAVDIQSNGFIEFSDGFAYKHNRPSSADIASIGEMVFGALAMSFRSTALKVHWLESPARVLCSQVFLSPIPTSTYAHRKTSINLTVNPTSASEFGNTDCSSLSSFSMPFSVCVNENLNLLSEKSLTNPLDVPPSSSDTITSEQSRTFSMYSGGDSGYSGQDTWTTTNSSCQYSTRSSLGSVYSDPESARKLSLESSSIFGDSSSSSGSSKTSNGSFQRRISRNIYTSFENRSSMSDFIGFIGDNYQTATGGGSEGCVTRYAIPLDVGETRSNPEMMRKRGTGSDVMTNPNFRHGGGKRAKLGLAVFITLTESFEKEMELFCSEHIALLEAMLCRLRASVETAYINHKHFLPIMLRAWKNTTKWLCDLFTAPRLPCPVWLTLSSGASKNLKHIADNFINELCFLLSSADTKDTNFFISTMLTAVLTHHLGWVSTVAAVNSKPKAPISEIVYEQNAKLIEIAKRHPYNALWAQMGDLYGAVGNPPKISRTIIYGSEKHTVNKVLNILTYFIRCGEVRRVMKAEVFDKDAIDKIVEESISESKNKKEGKLLQKSKMGLARTKTCSKDLQEIFIKEGDISGDDVTDSVITTIRRNDIPNVLAFRDSHFVQQELRIGNYLMDTGIEMNQKQKMELKGYQIKDTIRLTVTSPDNIETNLTYTPENETGALEAIEIEPKVKGSKYKTEDGNIADSFFWSIEPIEEGISCKDVLKLQKGAEKINRNSIVLSRTAWPRSANENTSNAQSSKDERNETEKRMGIKKKNEEDQKTTTGNLPRTGRLKATKSHTSLSDLITANSVGQSQRLMWGIEPIKENISLEEEKHFELSKKIVEKERENSLKATQNEVVFVLGDNEALVNIKKSSEDLQKLVDDSNSTPSPASSTSKPKPTCNHKKHSGVKFNFEQYPQIATNYMKNKNLDLSNYDFLEKSSKLEEIFNCGPSTSTFPVGLSKVDTEEEECEYCAGACSRILQTPSNATELEFSSEDNYPTTSVLSSSIKNSNQMSKSEPLSKDSKSDSTETLSDIRPMSAQVNAESCDKQEADVNLIEIPMPASKSASAKEGESHVKPGFTSSLLVGVSDHYISDMVLQGTTASPAVWEVNLKQDLALSAHCASIIPSPTENVAVVADLDKWDVKVISSQTHILPYGNATSGPVGMSQLVSSMLETVLAMSSSGISAYECLSYLELKLQEMYLQSETLAAFLLATEFCSLNTLTSALNLSANDVPLLLSVASIHSPQVTKKYGVSSR